MSYTHYFLDTEFIEDGSTIDLISIGVVSDSGKTLYLESAEAALERANDFVRKCVLPKLGPVEKRVSRAAIAKALTEFVKPCVANGYAEPLFVAYYAAYDWLAVCQLFGTMMNLPPRWPMFCMDLRQLMVHKGVSERQLPALDEDVEHNALADASWCRDAWRKVSSLPWKE